MLQTKKRLSVVSLLGTF